MEGERFKQLYSQREGLYTENAPVIIEKGVLLLDLQTNTVIIQLKFHSISEKRINALKIRIITYYTSGEMCSETVEYEYLDLLVENGGIFGADKAILLKDKTIRSFSIESYNVVFSDKTVETIREPFKQLPASKELQEEWINVELQKQYRLETTEYSKYVPIQYGNLWKCACGIWNSRNFCGACHCEKDKIFSKFDVDFLTSSMESRLKKEAAEREEQRKREEVEAQRQEVIRQEEEIKRKKLLKTVWRVAVPAIFVSIFAFGFYPGVIKPSMEYKHAKELLSEEKFDESIDTFEALGDYKDSADMITEARCLKAKSLVDKKEYDAAKEIYEDLGKEDAVKEVTYQEAKDLLSEKKYADAINILMRFEYKDSDELLQEAEYDRGIELMEQESYVVATGYFRKAKDYKDASSKVGECKYLRGIEHMKERDYNAALNEFKYIYRYDDGEVLKKAEEKIKECEEKLNQRPEVESEDIAEEYAEDFSYSGIENGSVRGKIKLTGKVLQVVDAENGSMYIRLELNSNKDEIVFVTCKEDDDWSIENKIITVYGTTYGGKFSYESLTAGTITLPWIPADRIEVE